MRQDKLVKSTLQSRFACMHDELVLHISCLASQFICQSRKVELFATGRKFAERLGYPVDILTPFVIRRQIFVAIYITTYRVLPRLEAAEKDIDRDRHAGSRRSGVQPLFVWLVGHLMSLKCTIGTTYQRREI